MQTSFATPTFNADVNGTFIDLEQLGIPVQVLAAEDKAIDAGSVDELKSMEQARISWETTELAASNNRLYSILRTAYSFYLVMKKDEDADVRKKRVDALTTFIKERAYTFMPSTHDMTRVVKCVFGVDRRRVSAYSIALREALRQEIDAEDLVDFLTDNGGVEQIRTGGSKPLSASKRAAHVVDEVRNNSIGKFKFDAKLTGANADWTDKQVIIIATYLPTGEFDANVVIKHDGAVNAALAAYYSNQQAEQRAQRKAETEMEKEAEAQRKADESQQRKDEKMAKQIAGVAAERAEKARVAANKAHAETLFEAALPA